MKTRKKNLASCKFFLILSAPRRSCKLLVSNFTEKNHELVSLYMQNKG